MAGEYAEGVESTDALLRRAIAEKRLIEFRYKGKVRVVEPHDYGVHNGEVKLFGYQVGGESSQKLPNWRWGVVGEMSEVKVLEQKFAGGRGAASGKHHTWEKVFARVAKPEE
ncbi:hypothetical protein F183_A13760 [Bryobacterales bacterium F-183]|nr:hypothetical protein F183_A13760 [Bryobacterales bacterium F-183]